MATFNGMKRLLTNDYRDYVVALAGAIAVDYRFQGANVTVFNDDESSLIWLKVRAGEVPVIVEVRFGYYLKKQRDSADMQSLYIRISSDGDTGLALRYRMNNGDDPIEFIKWFADKISTFCDMVKDWKESEE